MIDAKLHRADGPAVEYASGKMSWYINGVAFTNFKDYQRAGGLTDREIMVLRLKYGEIG